MATQKATRARAAAFRFERKLRAPDDPRGQPAHHNPELPNGRLDYQTACPRCGRLAYEIPEIARSRDYVSPCATCYLNQIGTLTKMFHEDPK